MLAARRQINCPAAPRVCPAAASSGRRWLTTAAPRVGRWRGVRWGRRCPGAPRQLLGDAQRLQAVGVAVAIGFGSATARGRGLALCQQAPTALASPSRAVATSQAQEGGGRGGSKAFSLWAELGVLVKDNLLWILLGTGALVLATIFQTKHVSKLTADLTHKVLSFDATASDSAEKRQSLLATLWDMIYWQAATQALQFAGGLVQRLVTKRIQRGLQLSMYAHMLRQDASLFDSHQTGELVSLAQPLPPILPCTSNRACWCLLVRQSASRSEWRSWRVWRARWRAGCRSCSGCR